MLGMALPLQRAWLPGSGPVAWVLDLFSHWQPVHAALWLLACLLGASGRRRWLLGLPFALLPWATASRMAAPAEGPAKLVVAAANVQRDNHDPAPLLAWLERHPANLVVLTELSPAYAEALQRRAPARWRHRALHPQLSPPGLGVLSDRPLHDVRVLPDALGALRIEADFLLDGVDVRLVAIHPKPPWSTRKHEARDRLLGDIAAVARARPVIVAGDANATPWSSALLATRARGLARATGNWPTYPTEGGGIAGVAIDHILVSPHFARVHAERGPDIGSDHLPVRAGLRWRGE